ncbi:TrmH family RNA methyltransferase [Maribellus mangrovi]|uniref:TrmH family RNA methyltransferase n=1 Tax=Maribellus mangrovi TaxID=3133146 RepID=UPI0030EC3DD3
MISKNTIKRLNSLSQKKYRAKENLFLVEGDKMVSELAGSDIVVKELYITSDFEFRDTKSNFHAEQIHSIERSDLKKISQLKTPQNSLAVCQILSQKELPDKLDEPLSVYSDGIQDPGNLGTIIRLCDWFGIKQLFCSKDTVDLYSPKVIQASMGSFMRLNVYETDLKALKELTEVSDTTIYGAFMDGANIYTESLAGKSILVVGNEGNGIREASKLLIDKKISIPNFSAGNSKAESLNVSMATAILCSEFKRR